MSESKGKEGYLLPSKVAAPVPQNHTNQANKQKHKGHH